MWSGLSGAGAQELCWLVPCDFIHLPGIKREGKNTLGARLSEARVQKLK